MSPPDPEHELQERGLVRRRTRSRQPTARSTEQAAQERQPVCGVSGCREPAVSPNGDPCELCAKHRALAAMARMKALAHQSRQRL
jgi:hypothetical protein